MKEHFRKIPSRIQKKLSRLPKGDVVVACAMIVRADVLGAFVHLGLRLTPGGLTVPPSVTPPAGRRKAFTEELRGL